MAKMIKKTLILLIIACFFAQSTGMSRLTSVPIANHHTLRPFSAKHLSGNEIAEKLGKPLITSDEKVIEMHQNSIFVTKQTPIYSKTSSAGNVDYEKVERLLRQVHYIDTDTIESATIINDIYQEPATLYIQNNRSGICSGSCTYCYKRSTKKQRNLSAPMTLNEIEKIIHKAFKFNIRTISLNGEDSFDDFQSLIAIARACVIGKSKIPDMLNFRLNIFTNGYGLISNLESAEKKLQELKNTGALFRLCFSWDTEKVEYLKARNSWSEDEVITAMAMLVINFRKKLPGSEIVLQNTFAPNNDIENRNFAEKLQIKIKERNRDKEIRFSYYIRGKAKIFSLDIKKRQGNRTGPIWREKFRELVNKAQRGEFTCNYEPFIDMATSTVSNCHIYSSNFNRKISADNFKETILLPFRYPLTRHLYTGGAIKGLAKCREFLFACSIKPEYWNEPFYFEQIDTAIVDDGTLRTKISLLFLLRDILLNYERGDSSLPAASYLKTFSKELIPALVDDEILSAYLRYVDELRYAKWMQMDNIWHGFFNFYYIWSDYKRGKIADADDLLMRISNICKHQIGGQFLNELRRRAIEMGGEFGSNSNADKLQYFFDKLSVADMHNIFRWALLNQILPQYHTEAPLKSSSTEKTDKDKTRLKIEEWDKIYSQEIANKRLENSYRTLTAIKWAA